jgi:cobalt ECF transporter T component CbiQ
LILDRSWSTDASSANDGFLQRLDPRVKLGAAAVLIVHAAATTRLWTVAVIVTAVVVVAAASRLELRPIFRLWLTVGVLAALLAVPALFLTPGARIVFRIPVIGWNISDTGLLVAGRLLLRALASSTTAAVLVLSTQWQAVLKALRRFGVPTVAVMLIGMSYRYIVLFVQSAIELTNARKSRTVGRMRLAERRRLALSSVGVLLERAFSLGNEVHLAMQARGYRGEVLLLDDYSMSARDWVAIAVLVFFEVILIKGASLS